MARKNYLSNYDPLVNALCNKALSCGYTKCEKSKKASNMMGSQINICLSSVLVGAYGMESRDGITIEANVVEDDKEYLVYHNTELRIEAAVAASQSTRKSQLSPATVSIDTTNTTCLIALFAINKDTHNCPVCDAPGEDRDHLFTCPDEGANKVYKKGINELAKIMEEQETASEIQREITGNLMGMRTGNQPHTHSFDRAHFGRGLSLRSILCDQADLGWINFFLIRWSGRWREAQQRHYRNMNKRKSARSWAIALIKKLMMIQWDLWQYRNTILHSPTGPSAIASHQSLNHRISKEKSKGMDGIAKSYTHLFSAFYSITKLQSRDISSKILWLEMVRLARAEYEVSDSAIIR